MPSELQGRVGSVNLIDVFGGLVVGARIGGLLAQHDGVAAPFWFAFVGAAVFVLVIWRHLRHIAHADDPEAERAWPPHQPRKPRIDAPYLARGFAGW